MAKIEQYFDCKSEHYGILCLDVWYFRYRRR